MSKRKLNAMQAEIDSLQGRVSGLQGQVSGLIKTVTELLLKPEPTAPEPEPEPKLKTLDQSVFDGLDEKWQWAAIDKNSSAYTYSKKPRVAHSKYWLLGIDGSSWQVNGAYDATDWQNSLIKREVKAELTGSDLCRAMLKNGYKFVLCFVSDDGDELAVENGNAGLAIPENTDNCDFYFINDSYWRYAVPIDNNGNLLTAKDVGL